MVHLDDGIVAVEGKEAALRASESVKEDLSKTGFVTHIGKSHWDSTRSINMARFSARPRRGKIKIPKAKLVGQQTILGNVKVEEKVSAKYLASLLGKIMALSIVVGPVARHMTRNLHAVLNSRTSWFQKLDILPEAKDELMFGRKVFPDYRA